MEGGQTNPGPSGKNSSNGSDGADPSPENFQKMTGWTFLAKRCPTTDMILAQCVGGHRCISNLENFVIFQLVMLVFIFFW